MRVRKSAMLPLLSVLPVLSALPAAAADITIEPRISSGVSYYNLDLDGRVVVGDNSVDDIEFNDWLLFVGGGATIAFDRFFVDVSGQYSFSGQDNLGLDVEAGGVAVNDLAQDVDFDRIETAISIGYRATDNFAGYVGFRYANVDFDGSGTLGGVGVDFSTDFEQWGPLVGASYIIPKTIFNGALVVNGAVTFLNGELENELDAPAPIGDVAFDIDGDAIGLNGGVSWATPLTDQLRLVIGGDISNYDFQDDGDETDFEELIARICAELRYSFDGDALFGR
ncbi:MAG: hypothetical protein ACR2RA_13805 [Geminicoccaceae bacterium]